MDKKTGLSPRQQEIMRLAAEGLTDKEIAQATGLSVGTLRSHWDRMRSRMGASSRGEVIARAAEETRRAVTAERDLLRHVLRLRRIFVWTATEDGTVDYVNDWFTQFSGLPEETLLGPGYTAMMPEEEQAATRAHWWEAKLRAVGYRTRALFRSATGALVPHLIEVAPLEVVDGRVVRWVGMASEACEA